jgi:hypothetical protein
MKRKPYFPSSPAAQVIWLTNYKTTILVVGPDLGLTPEAIAAEVEKSNKMIDAINEVETQKTKLKSAYRNRKNIIKIIGGELREEIKQHKTADGYNDTIGEDLGIIGESTDFDPNTFKTDISVETFGNALRFRFTKKGVTSVNIYYRKKGDEAWKLLSRAIKSPFNYQPVVETPNKPEHWEFRAFGLINDGEIGQPSKMVDIVFSL